MSNRSHRRVVVTGLGVVSNVGIGYAQMWESLRSGKSGIRPITAFEQSDDWTVTIAGEVQDFDASAVVEHREQKRMDRFSLLAMVAAEEAALDCGIDFQSGDPWRRGVVIGSGVGGILTIEQGHEKLLRTGPRKISPFIVPKLMVNAAAGNVSIRHNLRGANSSVATACATGGHAIGTAFDLIRDGDAEVMFAGGSEAAVTPLCLGSFAAMKALSTRNDAPEQASRPFDQDRDGFVLSEGAGVIVLEELEHARARGAKIYAEVCGFGTSGDAQHIAAPDENGAGAIAAMRAAMADGEINIDQIDSINAHGTSTPLGDAAEVKAVAGLFGDHARKIGLTSTKSMTGHALGAAGGIESVAVIMSVMNDVVPPTINLDKPDDGFDVVEIVANEAREKTVRYALNNSFGFGGHNVSLVFGKAP